MRAFLYPLNYNINLKKGSEKIKNTLFRCPHFACGKPQFCTGKKCQNSTASNSVENIVEKKYIIPLFYRFFAYKNSKTALNRATLSIFSTTELYISAKMQFLSMSE